MPWDEVLLAQAAAQEVEAESGPAVAMANLLAELLAPLFGD